MQPVSQMTCEYRFIALPSEKQMEAPTTGMLEQIEAACKELTELSAKGRVAQILKVDGGLVVGEMTGFVELRPDTGGVVPIPGILKPS